MTEDLVSLDQTLYLPAFSEGNFKVLCSHSKSWKPSFYKLSYASLNPPHD